MTLKEILMQVQNGTLSLDDAQRILKQDGYNEMDYAKLDTGRKARTGFAEVVYCSNKADDHLLNIYERLYQEEGEVLHSFDEIVMDDITFKYDDGIEEVLQHVNWTIKRGDFMALTGISGGGKTSLFQLLLGIYKPTKGRMLFRAGGLEVPASRGTRALFAYVPQGNTLFSGTLRDNLTMFTDEAADEEIRAAVDAACLTAVVAAWVCPRGRHREWRWPGRSSARRLFCCWTRRPRPWMKRRRRSF